jgi:hypothetical protein
MEDRHASERDRKARKARYGMRVSGRSTKSVLLPVIGKRASEALTGRTGKRKTKQSHPN